MEKKQEKKGKQKKDKLEAILRMGPDPADPQGSYTGRPVNVRETPVQDADDL